MARGPLSHFGQDGTNTVPRMKWQVSACIPWSYDNVKGVTSRSRSRSRDNMSQPKASVTRSVKYTQDIKRNFNVIFTRVSGCQRYCRFSSNRIQFYSQNCQLVNRKCQGSYIDCCVDLFWAFHCRCSLQTCKLDVNHSSLVKQVSRAVTGIFRYEYDTEKYFGLSLVFFCRQRLLSSSHSNAERHSTRLCAVSKQASKHINRLT